MPRPPRDTPKKRKRLPGRWLHGPIPVLGVVGGIGSGKSMVSAEMASRGAFLLDADAIGHVLLEQSPSRERVIERFGEGILEDRQEEGQRRPINRRALGAIVFARPEALRALESILHPVMRRTFEKAIHREARRGQVPAVVLDAAILYEAGWDDLCDAVVFVDASPSVRLSRLKATRGWTEEVLPAREKAQGPLEEKRKAAAHHIQNEGSPEDLKLAVDRLWKQCVGPSTKKKESQPPAPAKRHLKGTGSTQT